MRKFFSTQARMPLLPRLPRRASVALALLGATIAFAGGEDEAHAQSVGVASKPLPNILLLVDTSGSMERMADSSLPNQNVVTGLPFGQNACQAGVATNPNRWGMLLQALTGNFQPFYSCDAMDRAATNARFVREYQINGRRPYDTDYFLPYHRPLTGSGANACAITPWHLPGAPAGSGVGPSGYGIGGNTFDFPDNAFATIKYAGGGGDLNTAINGGGIGSPGLTSTECIFDQTPDGQLDAARDYVRFALMTFDNDTDQRTGASGSSVDLSAVAPPGSLQPPFLGQWSYLRNAGNPAYGSVAQNNGGLPLGPGAVGHPPGCAFQPFEVGARNEHAPPWEGRLVPFPNDDATLYDLAVTNERIQKALLAARPYGATPIDAMLDDARDYYDNKADWGSGPGLVVAPRNDRYQCRDKYIILLTDGAPNLDLRPSCAATGPGDVCPYPYQAREIARELAGGGGAGSVGVRTDSASVVQTVKTFVIGFSVNGSSTTDPTNGFPAGVTNCKTFYANAAYGGGNVNQMNTWCTGNPRPAGSTAEACCKLTELAWNGSYDAGIGQGRTGPFFAESQADIVLAFGQILAGVTKAATTRTLPAYSPTSVFATSDYGNTQRAGEFIASFIPNALKPWSGEIYRNRTKCTNGLPGADTPPSPNSGAAGDLMSVNLAEQTTNDANRRFISVKGTATGAFIDSARTIRPFARGTASTGSDSLPDATVAGYGGTEVSFGMSAIDPQWDLAMDIDNTTCKAGRAVQQGSASTRGTVAVPALTSAQCARAMWGFNIGTAQAITYSSYNFNVRCPVGGAGSASAGRCSITGTSCTVGGTACDALPGGEKGEVCVPDCSALGAIYHSNPAVVGPPQGFLREEGYRSFALANRSREPMLFTATTDGVLHAFKAMSVAAPNTQHELWAFIPPAVLPRVKSSYPAGNGILLDGAPVVKDVVWDRLSSDTGTPSNWHTTLVAGLGMGGRGYYALNVSDGACAGLAGNCVPNGNYQTPAAGALSDVSGMGPPIPGFPNPVRGPHFLWQLTDVGQQTVTDQGKVVRTARDNTRMVGIFGKDTGTPAVGTVQLTVGGVQRQVGVAILPGGIENPPILAPNGTPLTCARGNGSALFGSDPLLPAPRGSVRQWSSAGCSAPVPGRGVTIVRLDTGEVIRHFGRLNQDVPDYLKARTQDTLFDSPVVGTPVVFPDSPGTPIQRIFVGDADGTVWRINVSNTDFTQWRAELYQDLYAVRTMPAAAYEGQPISIAPTVTQDDGGAVVLNVATGEQESFVAPRPPSTGDVNYVYSIRENPTNLKAQVRWYQTLTASERVTGPMVVFDRTLYFATYQPIQPTGASCSAAGQARIWGMHFTDAFGAVSPTTGTAGGLPRLTACAGPAPCASVDRTGAFAASLIPGVAVRAQPSCTDVFTDPLGGGIGSMSSTRYELVFGVADKSLSGPPTSAERGTLTLPQPRTQSRIDSWAFITE